MTEIISSTRNPRIRELITLMEKSRSRREAGLFPVEGVRETEHAIEAGFVPEMLFHCPEILPHLPEAISSAARGNVCSILEVTAELYSRIAYREGTEGLVTVFRTPVPLTLDDLGIDITGMISGNPVLIMVAESIEKPGNIGALLRTADAVGADAVILCDPLTDLYNPNLIRASLGGVFTGKIVCCTSAEAISFLLNHSIQILTAQLQDSVPYYDSDMTPPTAIVFGTESTGLTQQWRTASSSKIRIPMLGRLDSLNVSVSAAILCFEALRQRNTPTLHTE
ncbi:MAG: RNA methyltransferase [Alistipes sp.]|nr:RNA methyltransferase [Candidatus Minthomonas equi]